LQHHSQLTQSISGAPALENLLNFPEISLVSLFLIDELVYLFNTQECPNSCVSQD